MSQTLRLCFCDVVSSPQSQYHSHKHDNPFIPKQLGLGEKSCKFLTNEDVDQKKKGDLLQITVSSGDKKGAEVTSSAPGRVLHGCGVRQRSVPWGHLLGLSVLISPTVTQTQTSNSVYPTALL